MYFKQLIKEDLGCACYILGCPEAGICAVVDPRIDMVEEILEATASREMRVRAVIETHTHADHVSGHGELARRTGAAIYVHPLAQVAFAHQDLADGDELRFGTVRIRAIHTPGHRPEHIALAVADLSRGDDPWLVLTGDSLFIGDLARPDLAVAGQEGAEALFESIFERLLKLDSYVEVYPAHVAGSLCGRQMNRKTSSTIGFERKYNTALLPRTRAAFVQMMNEHLPVRPPNLARVLQRNQEDFTRRVPAPRSRPLELAAFQQARAAGALVLDIRTPEAFCAGHIPGALHVFLHGAAFPTRVGFLVPPDKELLLIVEDEQDVALACQQLAVVGYEQIRGYLQGHMAAWQAAALPLQALAQIRATQLAEQLDLVTVLDVRDESEWQQGHIENALHIPFYELEARLSTLDTTCPYAVICAGGQRSALACSLLLRHGFGHVYNVTGGMLAWQALQLPLVSCATALDSVA